MFINNSREASVLEFHRMKHILRQRASGEFLWSAIANQVEEETLCGSIGNRIQPFRMLTQLSWVFKEIDTVFEVCLHVDSCQSQRRVMDTASTVTGMKCILGSEIQVPEK
jgi:hypothetical protein